MCPCPLTWGTQTGRLSGLLAAAGVLLVPLRLGGRAGLIEDQDPFSAHPGAEVGEERVQTLHSFLCNFSPAR